MSLQISLTCTDASLIPSSVARASRTVTPGYLFHWKTACILSSCLTVNAVLLRRCPCLPCLGPGGILPSLPDSVKLLSSVSSVFQECSALNYKVLQVRSLLSAGRPKQIARGDSLTILAVKTGPDTSSIAEFVVFYFFKENNTPHSRFLLVMGTLKRVEHARLERGWTIIVTATRKRKKIAHPHSHGFARSTPSEYLLVL